MNVTLNTQSAAGQKSGFGFYVSHLLKQIPAHGIAYQTVQPVGGGASNHLSTPRRFLWDQWSFAWAAIRSPSPVIHQPCFSTPVLVRLLAPRKKVVVTIHDIIPTLFPGNMALPSRLFFGHWMPFSSRFAHHYLTISEYSKRDLVTHLHLDPAKITVTPLAAGNDYRPLGEGGRAGIAEVLGRYGITGSYLLCVGTLEPRKNLPFLVRAFQEARATGKIPGCQLVLTGKKGWWQDELFKLADDPGVKEAIVFTGYVADEDLPALYNGATAFLFPSLYEGFGLPPLEAMACGTPVISSDASSMPEVVGDAGILLSPTDLPAWSEAIVRLVSDSALRKELAAKSLVQAKKYSWEENARVTAEVYKSLG